MKKGTVPILSVIIPTCGRPQILRRCLDAIAVQTVRDLEAVVVSDGPDDATAEMMQGLSWPFPIQYFAIPKSQQGVCRNRAAEKAGGRIALLIGDDILLAPDACEWHLRAHANHSFDRAQDEQSPIINYQLPITNYQSAVTDGQRAVLGFTTWDPALTITPLMKWMERSGVQFGYRKIGGHSHNFVPREQQHWFTYTSHLSLPTRLLRQLPFREDVSLYGWEDIEWGRRLAAAGVRLLYEPDARAYHHHAFGDDEIWERSRTLGASAVAMEELVPEMRLVPRGLKKTGYRLCSFLPTYRGRHCRMFLRGAAARRRG